MRLLTENLSWKIVAVVVAVLLWYGFVGETEVAASVPLEIHFRNVPPELEITSEQANRASLRLRGPATRLNAASLNAVTALFDLSQIYKPGEHTFPLNASTLQLPAGVEVVSVVPSQVRLVFEDRSTREIPIEVRYAGPPPPGYRVVRQQISPSTVRIAGPATRVQRMESAQTDAIDLSSTISNTEFRVPAYLPDPHLRFEADPPLISVRVFMEKIPQ